MEKKQIKPTPTDDPYILRVREIYHAMNIVLGFALTNLEKAKREDPEDIDLALFAVEANISTLFDLLFDGIGYSNMMH